ncbi:MAG: hypothetical protein MI700_09685 [Balneolales bacterium]|nr:hypothetical protein [Balneolales bacterium]
MKNIFLSLLFLFIIAFSNSVKSQTVELLGYNTLNGALNGTLLGGAYMALDNDAEDFTPLRIGLGFGTLYGIGIGGYDVVQGGGNGILVSGFFNDGNNSSIIVLMDTFYGLASGAIVATAMTLISGDPILEGIQYGASTGAFIGFGFGIIDSFLIAERTSGPSAYLYNPDTNAPGIVSVDFENGTSVGLVNPSLSHLYSINAGGLQAELKPNLQFVNVKIKL